MVLGLKYRSHLRFLLGWMPLALNIGARSYGGTQLRLSCLEIISLGRNHGLDYIRLELAPHKRALSRWISDCDLRFQASTTESR
jgi:hypothetical protein